MSMPLERSNFVNVDRPWLRINEPNYFFERCNRSRDCGEWNLKIEWLLMIDLHVGPILELYVQNENGFDVKQ